MAICVCLCEFTCESNYRTYSYDNNGTVTSIQVLFLFDQNENSGKTKKNKYNLIIK